MGGESIVVRRGEGGWQVGDEPAADLTSAMMLADLLAADLGGYPQTVDTDGITIKGAGCADASSTGA
jgi:hypothetical protein